MHNLSVQKILCLYNTYITKDIALLDFPLSTSVSNGALNDIGASRPRAILPLVSIGPIWLHCAPGSSRYPGYEVSRYACMCGFPMAPFVLLFLSSCICARSVWAPYGFLCSFVLSSCICARNFHIWFVCQMLL